jgi:hypothetical protein
MGCLRGKIAADQLSDPHSGLAFTQHGTVLVELRSDTLSWLGTEKDAPSKKDVSPNS